MMWCLSKDCFSYGFLPTCFASSTRERDITAKWLRTSAWSPVIWVSILASLLTYCINYSISLYFHFLLYKMEVIIIPACGRVFWRFSELKAQCLKHKCWKILAIFLISIEYLLKVLGFDYYLPHEQQCDKNIFSPPLKTNSLSKPQQSQECGQRWRSYHCPSLSDQQGHSPSAALTLWKAEMRNK